MDIQTMKVAHGLIEAIQAAGDPKKWAEASKAHTEAVALSEKEQADRKAYEEAIIEHGRIIQESKEAVAAEEKIKEANEKAGAAIHADREILMGQKDAFSDAKAAWERDVKASYEEKAKQLEKDRKAFDDEKEEHDRLKAETIKLKAELGSRLEAIKSAATGG